MNTHPLHFDNEYEKAINMSYYDKHVFLCTNQRTNGRKCCNDEKAQELLVYAKNKIKLLECNVQNKIRTNSAGCMDRCAEGPVLVIYPDAVWYYYQTQE